MEIALVLGLTVIILALYFGSNYKQLTEQRLAVEEARKKLDEQLKKRHTAMDDVAQTYHGKHEQLWASVSSARDAAVAATNGDTTARAAAESELSEALGLYFVQLQKEEDTTEFTDLRDRVYEVEDGVNSARDDFNTMAARYNMSHHVFPNSIFAQNLGLKPIAEMPFEGAFERHPLKFKGTQPIKKPPLYLQQRNPKKNQETPG
jgi:LemA protein